MSMQTEKQSGEFDQIEIRVFQGRVNKYRLELRLPTDRFSAHAGALPAGLAEGKVTDVHAYGKLLSEWLFGNELGEAFRRARWAAESYVRSALAYAVQEGVAGLRVRLWIEPGCKELHVLNWETINDPVREEPLALTTAFSRSTTVSALPPRFPPSPLRMLLITASPDGLARFDLSQINVDLERRVVESAMGQARRKIEVVKLGPRVTLDEMQNAEKQGFHITHFVAHAVDNKDGSGFLLTDRSGTVATVPCIDVVHALVSPSSPPALLYVATPTEGERQGAATNLVLGRMLLEAGVQAVVVIQAPIDADRLMRFTERFYSVLLQTGAPDRAVADARVAIYEPDSWKWAYPVLFMRAGGGDLALGAELEGFESLLTQIKTS